LRRAGVAVDRVLRGGSRLGLYFVEPGADLRAMRVVYDRAGSAFAQITPADVDWPAALAGARWLHGTGITPALGDGPAATLTDGFAAASERGVTVSLDLNYREALSRGWGRQLHGRSDRGAARRSSSPGRGGVRDRSRRAEARPGRRLRPVDGGGREPPVGDRPMYMTFRWFGPTDPIPLGHIRQIPGVQGVVSALYDVPVGETW